MNLFDTICGWTGFLLLLVIVYLPTLVQDLDGDGKPPLDLG